MKYILKYVPRYELKKQHYGHTRLPRKVSFFGSPPDFIQAYHVRKRPTLHNPETNTNHNYFYGKVYKDLVDFLELIERLKADGVEIEVDLGKYNNSIPQ